VWVVSREGDEIRRLGEELEFDGAGTWPESWKDGSQLYLLNIEAGITTSSLWLEDLSARAAPELIASNVSSAAWSPDGTLLAMAGPLGLRVFDLVTRLQPWVAVGECTGVRWLE
jgi:hypothetical protein